MKEREGGKGKEEKKGEKKKSLVMFAFQFGEENNSDKVGKGRNGQRKPKRKTYSKLRVDSEGSLIWANGQTEI